MTKELKKRIITSIVLISIVLNCLFINNYSWLALLAIISLICWLEFMNLIKRIWKKKTITILPTIISLAVLYFFLYSAYKIKVEEGEKIILFILLVCMFSDIGGYVVGKSIGGKKLTKISPNKTISGSIGSFLFSLFPIGILSILTKITEINLAPTNLNDQLIICLILSLACQLGDLIISYFKRLAKTKDTGNILPGHGGMLDRIDGIIFAIPSLFIIYYIL